MVRVDDLENYHEPYHKNFNGEGGGTDGSYLCDSYCKRQEEFLRCAGENPAAGKTGSYRS